MDNFPTSGDGHYREAQLYLSHDLTYEVNLGLDLVIVSCSLAFLQTIFLVLFYRG